MHFRTTLKSTKSNIDIAYDDSIITLGSCFAENIGSRLLSLHFKTLLNPFGILYNPISIAKNVTKLLSDTHYSDVDIFQHNGLWHSWDYHSRFSMPQKDDILRGMNQSLSETRNFLKNTTRLIITVGTTNVFIEKKTNEVVANCHKVPPRNAQSDLPNFDRKKLSVEDIVISFSDMIENLNVQYPNIQIIMTVSPIRHIKDGLIENQRSKATLILAVDDICQRFGNVHYFPAYELMMDDLRDYRFYEADMIHPTSQAIDYIWAFFKQTFFNNKTTIVANEVHIMNTMLQHRPLHPDTEGYQQFANSVKNKLKELKSKYPFLNY